MPAHPAATPIAFPARKIDFADYAPPQQIRILGFNDFPDKLVSRDTAESVVAATKFEVGIADAARQKSNQREAFFTPWPTHVP